MSHLSLRNRRLVSSKKQQNELRITRLKRELRQLKELSQAQNRIIRMLTTLHTEEAEEATELRTRLSYIREFAEGWLPYLRVAAVLSKDNSDTTRLLRAINNLREEGRQYAELRGTLWYILSDKFGLLPNRWKEENKEKLPENKENS